MLNFNNEEQDIYEMYKGETEAETLDNLKVGLAEAPEEMKAIILAVINQL